MAIAYYSFVCYRKGQPHSDGGLTMTSTAMNQFGGAWTQRKLEILRGYLNSYTTALKQQHFNLTYVDAFAGTGYIVHNASDANQGTPLLADAVDHDTAGVLKGSARLALEVTDRPFDQFVFVERNPAYARELHKLKADFAIHDVCIEQADANAFLPEWCENRNQHFGVPWRYHRAVVFLDPFATEVDWRTVRCIADTKSVDLWILFPLSALTRILPREREPDDAYAHTLDRVYGSPEWRNELYQTITRNTLFGNELVPVRSDQQAIVDAYLRKLESIFAKVAPSPKWFHNSRNSPQFAFMFAASNPSGAPIAVQIANHLLRNW